MPRVSFILPVHNAGPTLASAVESLLSQTFADFDVQIFDDGSTDDTLDIVERYAALDGRIRIAGSERVGIVEALRRGILASRAPLIARMDGDDLSHPKRLEDTLALLDAAPDLAVASTLVEGFPAGALGAGMGRYIDWLNGRISADGIARDIFVESPLCHPAVVMRRDAYEAVGGYLDDGGPEDYGLWLRFHRHGYAMAKCPKVRFSWRDSGKRLSRTDPRYARERFVATKVAVLEQLYLSDDRRVVIWGTGKIGRMISRALEKRGCGPQAFIDIDPKKIGRTVHGVPVLAVPSSRSALPGGLLLSAVGSVGAREKIRAHLEGIGLRERCHFISVA